MTAADFESVNERMHDLISFSVSHMTLFEMPRQFRYVSDGKSSCILGMDGSWKSLPTFRPTLVMYSIPTTIL